MLESRTAVALRLSKIRQHWVESPELFQAFETRKVFLNIPYTPDYWKFEVAICTTLVAYDLIPITAKHVYRETVILDKIIELIGKCGYGISDLSFPTKMNLPFEHGIILGTKGVSKSCALATSFEVIKEHMSDLQGLFIKEHGDNPAKLVVELSQWLLANATSEIHAYRRDIQPDSITAVLDSAEAVLRANPSYGAFASRFDELWLEAPTSLERFA